MWSTLLILSTAHGAIGDFSCAPDDGAIVGVPPLEVHCALDPIEGAWGRTVWRFGEGTVSNEDAAVHTYDAAGQYSISVTLEDYEGTDGTVYDLTNRVDGLVTVCGQPEPGFVISDKGGLVYEVTNQTDVSAPRCIDRITWDVYRGDRREGATLLTQEGWEARFTLPEDGLYTVVLTVEGLGGSKASSLLLDAKYGLTDDITDNYALSCASTPASLGWLAPLFVLAFARRRDATR